MERGFGLLFIAVGLLIIGIAAGCQSGSTTESNTGGVQADNTAKADNTAATPEIAKDDVKSAELASLASPGDAYVAAYNARKDKDMDALKRALSKDALEFFTDMGKESGKTLEDSLKELMERPQAATAESRNVKIDGDKATLEYLTEKGDWGPMDFVKEGDDWKLTIPKMEDAPADKK